MKTLIRRLSSIEQYLWVWLGISIVCVLAIELWLIHYSEVVWFGAELGRIVSGLALAYMSSFIFFVLVVHLPQERDREVVDQVVAYHVLKLIQRGGELVNGMYYTLYQQQRFEFPEREELRQWCKELDPRSTSPMPHVGPYREFEWSWFAYFHQIMTDAEDHIEKIHRHVPHVKPDLLRLLHALDECRMFTASRVNGIRTRATRMDHWTGGILEYFDCVTRLDSYYTTYLSATDQAGGDAKRPGVNAQHG